tara:strand:+ start:8872 stop:9057 length:186 start_codon:yes stop_codon:yes gene_type:complete
VFNALVASLSQKIETQAIFFLVKNFHKDIFKNSKLCWLHFALEDGVLYSHTIIQASFGDVA